MALLAVLLSYVAAAWMCAGVAAVDPMIDDFRQYFREVLDQAAAEGNWTDVVGVLPDAQEVLGRGYGGWVTLRSGLLEDLDKWSRHGDCLVSQQGEVATAAVSVVFDDLRYTYDFVTDDQMFHTAVGQIYGKVSALTAQLVVQGNISDTSRVTMSLVSFQLLPTQYVTSEEISQQNVTDVATFSPYIDNALVGFITDVALPAVQGDVAGVLNVTVADLDYQLSPESFYHTTATSGTPARSTDVASTITTPVSTSTGSSSPSKTTTSGKISLSTTTTSSKSTPSRTTTSSKSTPSKTTTSGKITPSTTTTSGKSTPSTTTTSGKHTPSTTTTSGKSTSGPTTTTGHRRLGDGDPRTTGATLTAHEMWLRDNFNGALDSLLTVSGEGLASRNMTPYSMPEGQREMVKKEDGSVLLTGGHVTGLGGFHADDSELSVRLLGDSATFAASMVFHNVTFRFDFSAATGASQPTSGVVSGVVASLRGEAYFLAEHTDDMSVFNYTFQDLRLTVTSDVQAVVDSNQTLTDARRREVAHAARSDITSSFVPRLQEALATAVRVAASTDRAPGSSPGGGGGSSSSFEATSPSVAALVASTCWVLASS